MQVGRRTSLCWLCSLKHVQLFGNVHSVKTKKWKIAWGLELNNYKQNHLELCYTRSN